MKAGRAFFVYTTDKFFWPGTIRQKQEEIDVLNKRVKKLKGQYKDMVLHAYKSRNKNGQMMFVLSADNYYEAQKRNKYLKNITALHKKQVAIIATNQNKIKDEIIAVEIEKEKKAISFVPKTFRAARDCGRQKKRKLF